MFWNRWLRPNESLVAIDIGASEIKLLELELGSDKPKILAIGSCASEAEIFANHAIAKPERLSELILGLMESSGISERRVVTALPGPSAFTKKLIVPEMDLADLETNINFEASSFIPYNIEDVRLDFHVLRRLPGEQMEVLVVAVKNEIIDGYLETFSYAGIDPAVLDIDSFALQNCFELGYPERAGSLTALVNMGERYSSITICQAGITLFSGDVTLGGKTFTDALAQQLNVPIAEAEQMKRGLSGDPAQVREVIDANLEFVASEFNRQLSFFWNACGVEENIESIMLSGGAAQTVGLLDELGERTGTPCTALDSFRGLAPGENIDAAYLDQVRSSFAVAVGLGLRQPGDKVLPDDNDQTEASDQQEAQP